MYGQRSLENEREYLDYDRISQLLKMEWRVNWIFWEFRKVKKSERFEDMEGDIYTNNIGKVTCHFFGMFGPKTRII